MRPAQWRLRRGKARHVNPATARLKGKLRVLTQALFEAELAFRRTGRRLRRRLGL